MHIGITWIFWTGVGFAAVGTLGLFFAFFGDMLKGLRGKRSRRRCPRCWYDMSGTPGLTCPECGRTAPRERRLARSHRRWRRAMLSTLLMGLGAGGVCNAPIAGIRWVQHAPSAILVRVLEDPTISRPPAFGSPPSRTPLQLRIFNEVIDRYAAGELSLGDRRVLAAKQIIPGLPPVSIRTRPVWPIGVEPGATLIPRFGGVLPRRFEARATFDGAKTIVAYHGGMTKRQYQGQSWWDDRSSWAGGLQSLGTPPGPADQITFEGRILEQGEEIWHGTWTIQARITDQTDDEVFVPFASDELTDAVREAVEGSLRLTPDLRGVTMKTPPDSRLRETAVSLSIEFVHDEQAVARADLSWSLRESELELIEIFGGMGREFTVKVFEGQLRGDVDAVGRAAMSPEGWAVRIRGTPDLLRDSFGLEHYWAGKLEVPLSVLLEPDE